MNKNQNKIKSQVNYDISNNSKIISIAIMITKQSFNTIHKNHKIRNHDDHNNNYCVIIITPKQQNNNFENSNKKLNLLKTETKTKTK